MAHAGEHHGHAVLVGGGDHFRIAHGTAGLDYRADAGRMSLVDTVAERKERIRSHDRSGNRKTGLGRLHPSYMGTEDPAHLPGSYPHRAAVAGVDDGVR